MSKGLYEDEYSWAKNNPQDPDAKQLLSLAEMYIKHPDNATLGLIQGAAAAIRKRTK